MSERERKREREVEKVRGVCEWELTVWQLGKGKGGGCIE